MNIRHYTELSQQAFGIFTAPESASLHLSDDEAPLKSELPGVADEQWTKFVKGMITAELSTVSLSNELGMFQMKPRRLADLGIVNHLSRTKGPSGRTVWVADFIAPMTSKKFLRSAQAQYTTFVLSTTNYAKKIRTGEIVKDSDMTLSGALAILHRAGPQGLNSWKNGDIFPETRNIYDIIKGIF